MDVALIFGLILAVGAVFASDILDGGSIASLINPSAALLIIGGTLGATLISYSMSEILTIPRLFLSALRAPKGGAGQTVERLVAFAVKARREGLLSLEAELADLDQPYLRKGMQMVVDGADPEMVRSVMETEIATVERQRGRGAQIFETAGGYAPTMGIIGTVLGLIHVLSSLTNAAKLGAAIAVAFLATFYGISTANLFWLPIAGKLKGRAHAEVADMELILEGVLSIQRGDNPTIVREKLSVFLDGKPAPAAADPLPAAATEPGGEVA